MCPQWSEVPSDSPRPPTDDDLAAVATQLGREPRGVQLVAHRCPCGAPDVVQTAPRLPDGTPFPTTFYLTCPKAASEVGTLEARGVMKDMTQRLAEDPALAEQYQHAHTDYLARREQLEHVPEIAGISSGGMPDRVKCLHALLGHALAAGEGVNPLGDETLQLLPRWWANNPCSARNAIPVRRAAIDCGTNTLRLLIADGTGRDLVRRAEIVRLGQDVDRTGRLAPAALARTRTVLESFAEQLTEYQVAHVRMVATSATRDASNAEEFTAIVREVLGITPDVISGAEEARLTFGGATKGIAGAQPPYLVLDIGGGSTEIIAGPQAAISMDIGCVRLTERYLRSDPPTESEFAELTTAVRVALRPALAAVPNDTLNGAGTLVGVAGTVTTLTALSLGVERYDSARVHGASLGMEQIEALLADLSSVPTVKRVRSGLLPAGRADVILAGAVILREVMHAYGAKKVFASEHDILDGILSTLPSADG